jgi:hypothetical protein
VTKGDLNRRDKLERAGGAGLLGLLAAFTTGTGATSVGTDDKPIKNERDCVLAAGLTSDEADCWELAAKLAGKYFELPELHPMEKQEIASAIHIIQYRLLSRPTYRKYKDVHKKLPKE